MHATRRTAAAAIAGVMLTAGLAGCSKSVEKTDVEQELQKLLKAQAPDREFTKSECEDDLPAEKDKTVDCAITIDGKPSKFTAKVTEVDGENVKFSFEPAK